MNEAMQRARLSLDGLSVGDAWGECFFFSPDLVWKLIRAGAIPGGPPYDVGEVERFVMSQVVTLREVPALPPWKWTDDTAMALSIYENLRDHGDIEADALAWSFGQRYQAEPMRGYGPAMHTLLPRLALGDDWRHASRELFRNEGSFGNGAAMRVAPVGAFFADDVARAVAAARASAEITHAHPEGVAGAIAVAAGAALAWQERENQSNAGDWLDSVLPHIPPGQVRQGVERARELPNFDAVSVEKVVAELGNGGDVTAQDTVPFVLWCAAQHLGDYEAALWLTVSGLGDRDTTCAMVGGIVALSSRLPIPADWLQNRESLPEDVN